MDSSKPDVDPGRLGNLQDAFNRAWRAAEERRESHYVLLGRPVRIRIAGGALAAHIHEAFAHLSAGETAAAPCLTVDLWDVRETGVPVPDAGGHWVGEQTWGPAEDRFTATHDRRVVGTHLPGSGSWLDRRAGHAIGWFADGDSLTTHERSKPLYVLLAVWASDRGVHGVHAALVGQDGSGVLVPGGSGAGKSTVALACLCAGQTYFGDDWIGLARVGNVFEGYGFYGAALLEARHATRFPLLQPHIVRPPGPGEGKALLPLASAFSTRLGHSTRVCALALPRIVARSGTRVGPASPREALLTLMPSSAFMMRPRGGRAGIERLAQLARELPAYWLEIGSDLDDIPRGVDEILVRATT